MEHPLHFRKYGKGPFHLILVHGGPGAPGEMAPLAQELCSEVGVIEHLQQEDSIAGQIEGLRHVIEKPVILIGWSWGALLSYLFTAHYPNLVKKLILISSAPFTSAYADQIAETRAKRMSGKQKENLSLEEIVQLYFQTDSYAPIVDGSKPIEYQPSTHEKVWKEAVELRTSGKLLESGYQITCPVVAIHGDYDPHPYEGVKEPLSKVLQDFKFILLQNCGHYPWFEKMAKDQFFHLLKQEIKNAETHRDLKK